MVSFEENSMKQLLLGVSDFKKTIENNGFYVDKTLLIKELIDNGAEVTLIPRPRRFGKTINMSMLHYFFEAPLDGQEENQSLFDGLKISKEDKKYLDYRGKYPVIFLSFKDVKEDTWEECFLSVQGMLSEEFIRHKYILDFIENEVDKQYINDIINRTSNITDTSKALKKLSNYLHLYYGQKTILILDEYDMPLTTGYTKGYYEKVRNFMRNLLSGGLKDNTHLEKGILTGILRVAKESIFSGLNNPSICTIVDKEYASYFGFTEEEVIQLLKYYSVTQSIEDVRKWYNGYLFGNTVIYNPWSIVEFIRKGEFDCYWVNTSSNDIIQSLITKAPGGIKKEIEKLLNHESIEKVIDKSIIYDDLGRKEKTLWNLLLFSGYLKAENVHLVRTRKVANFTIPNMEVYGLFEDIIIQWIDTDRGDSETTIVLKDALITGDYELFKDIFTVYVEEAFSYFDVGGDKAEDFYHAFVLGIMVSFRDVYEVKSNRESGYGRYDVMLIPRDTVNHYGIIFEFKRKRPSETLEEALTSGVKQLQEKQYKQELISRGVAHIREIAIAFEGKRVLMEGK